MAVYLGDKIIGFNNIINQSNTIVTPLNITAEGTYTAPTGQAYSPITVNVGEKLKSSVIRPDAELIKSYSGDYLGVTDMGMTITQPYDTTSRTPLAAGAHLTTTTSNSEPIDLNNYDYSILFRLLTIPIYNITTVGKGREEYQMCASLYQYTNLPTIGLPTLVNNTTFTTTSATCVAITCHRTLVWSSASALTFNTGTSYGVLQLISTAPSISSNKLIIKSPSILIRGNTSYLTSTYYNALTDVHAQYIIDIYRAPKHNLNVDGFGILDEMTKIIHCVRNNNQILV